MIMNLSIYQIIIGDFNMKVKWEIDDGYIGGSRPQITEIPDDVINGCMDDQEKQMVIDEYIQSDFEKEITWFITD